MQGAARGLTLTRVTPIRYNMAQRVEIGEYTYGRPRQSITLPENVCRSLSKCRCRPPVSSAEFTVSSGFQYWLLLGGGISFAGTPTAV